MIREFRLNLLNFNAKKVKSVILWNHNLILAGSTQKNWVIFHFIIIKSCCGWCTGCWTRYLNKDTCRYWNAISSSLLQRIVPNFLKTTKVIIININFLMMNHYFLKQSILLCMEFINSILCILWPGIRVSILWTIVEQQRKRKL